MNCKKAEKLLIDYLYQELSPKKIVEVEKHLKDCDACTKTMESWRAIHQGYHRAAEEEPAASPYMKQKLLIAAREELERKPSFGERLLVLLKPAILLPMLIFAIATLLYLPLKSQKPVMQANKISPQKTAPESNATAYKAEQAKEQPKTLPFRRVQDSKETTDALKAYRDKEADLSLKQKAYGGEAEKKNEALYDEDARKREQTNEPPGAASSRSDTGMTAGTPAPAAEAPSPPPEAKPESSAARQSVRPEMQEEEREANAQLQPPSALDSKLSKDAASGEVYFQQAQSKFQQGDLKGGVTIAQEAEKHDNARALAVQFHQSGIQYQQNRDCEKAIPQFTIIVNNYRDYSEIENVLLRLGDCYAEIGQSETAKKVYSRLLQYPASHSVAAEKIRQINKKIQSQQDLKALGYVNQ